MPLPILSQPKFTDDADLLRLFHQAQLNWSRHLGEEIAGEFGNQIVNPDLTTSDANCVLNARIPPGGSVAEALHAWENAASVRRIVLNPSVTAGQTQPLVAQLLATGWTKNDQPVLRLRSQKPVPSVVKIEDLKIIPARSALIAFEQLLATQSSDAYWIEAQQRHLDDSHYDVLLALRERLAVGSIGLLAGGELGTIRQLQMSGPAEPELAALLIQRTLDVCGRSGFRHVLACPPQDQVPIFLSFGFTAIGSWISYDRPAAETQMP